MSTEAGAYLEGQPVIRVFGGAAASSFRRRLDDYVQNLEKAKVVLDAARRSEIILTDAKNLAFAQGMELIDQIKRGSGSGGTVSNPDRIVHLRVAADVKG